MGASQSELQNTLNKIPSLVNKPQLLRQEIENFVQLVPDNEVLNIKVDKKLVQIMLDLVKKELEVKKPTFELIMMLKATARLLKTRGFYTAIPKHNITPFVDILKFDDEFLLKPSLDIVQNLISCQVTPEPGQEKNFNRDEAEEQAKIAFFESGGYQNLVALLIRYSKAERENMVLVSKVLDILSMDLVDHLHTSRFVIVQRIVSLLTSHIDLLLNLTIHKNLSSRCYSSILLQGFMLHSPLNICKHIQDKCLKNGYLLYYVYFAIDGKSLPAEHPYRQQWYDSNLTELTRNLLSMITAGHDWNTHIVSRALPEPLLKVLDGQGQQQLTKYGKANKKEKEVIETTLLHMFNTGKVKKLNWHPVFESLEIEQKSPALIWTSRSKAELLLALNSEIENLGVQKFIKENAIWNYEAFDVIYPSLKRYLKVGKYYISRFIIALYNVDAKISMTNEQLAGLAYELFQRSVVEDDPGWKLACLRGIRAIYDRFPKSLQYFQIIPYFAWLIEPARQFPLSRDHIISFLLTLLKDNPENCRQFLLHGGLKCLLYYINLAHTAPEPDGNYKSFLYHFLQTLVVSEKKTDGNAAVIQATADNAVGALNSGDSNVTASQVLNKKKAAESGSTTPGTGKDAENGTDENGTALTAATTPTATATTAGEEKKADEEKGENDEVKHQTMEENGHDGDNNKSSKDEKKPAIDKKPTVIRQASVAQGATPRAKAPTTPANAAAASSSSSSSASSSSTSTGGFEGVDNIPDLDDGSGDREDLLNGLAQELIVPEMAERCLALLILLSRGGPRLKRAVCEPAALQSLSRLLLTPYVALRQVGLQLLLELLDDHAHLVPNLANTGIWSFFAYALRWGCLPQMNDLLSKYHLKQATQYAPSNQSVLTPFFPQPMVRVLSTQGSNIFCALLDQDTYHPELIWNQSLRDELLNGIHNQLAPYLQKLQEDPQTAFQYEPPQPIAYPSIERELCIGSSYLRVLIEVGLRADAIGKLKEIELTQPNYLFTELQSALKSRKAQLLELRENKRELTEAFTEELLLIIQSQMLVVKRYPKMPEVSRYDAETLLEFIQPNVLEDPKYVRLEKAAECLQTLLTVESANVAQLAFDAKGLDVIVAALTHLLQKPLKDTAEGDETKRQLSPALYQLLNCLSLMASKHTASLKFVEHTPTLYPLLSKLLSPSFSNNARLALPNLIMVACKCFYTFAQQSERLQQAMLDNGTVVYLIYLAVFYSYTPQANDLAAPNADGAGRSSPLPAATSSSSSDDSKTDGDGDDKSSDDDSKSGDADWTSKIRLGSSYVLMALMQNGQSNKRLQVVLEGLLSSSLYRSLTNPADFLVRIHQNPTSVSQIKKWKELLSNYLNSQIQIVDMGGRWLGYTTENFKFVLPEDAGGKAGVQ